MMRSKRAGRAWLVILFLLVGGGAVFAFTGLGDKLFGSAPPPVVGRAVQRGPLRISVTEKANLKAADSVVLKSEVEGRTTILSLIDEGTWVQKGTVVCQLDTSELVEKRVAQEITVQNAEAAYVKAKQNYDIQVSQNQSETAKADQNLEFAKLDLKKYVEGDYPQDQQKADEETLLADEELTRAKQEFAWSEKLAKAGFLENTQLEADRLAEKRAEITLNQKKRAAELLDQYEHPRQLQELQSAVVEMQRELDRVKLQADAKLLDCDAERRTSKARFDLEKEKLAKIDSQIEKARMVAPVDGMVVYFQEQGGGFRGNDDPIQEGTEVRERQEIITIPSARGMVADMSLHESVLEKVDLGMPCLVTVDAIPDRIFHGTVQSKAVLPDKNSWWANPDLRVYRTEVALSDLDERLRPGMSCSVDIVVKDLADVLYVPLQSIFLDDGKTVCFVSKDGAVEKRPVVVGANDGKWVVIEKGLDEGEIVLLSQPAGYNLKPAVDDRQSGSPEPPKEGAAEQATPGEASAAGQPAAGAPGGAEAARWPRGGDGHRGGPGGRHGFGEGQGAGPGGGGEPRMAEGGGDAATPPAAASVGGAAEAPAAGAMEHAADATGDARTESRVDHAAEAAPAAASTGGADPPQRTDGAPTGTGRAADAAKLEKGAKTD